MPYRVWWKPQVPMEESFYVEVPDGDLGRFIEQVLADYDLFQYENRIKPDYCNVGGTQIFNEETKEWEDLDEDAA